MQPETDFTVIMENMYDCISLLHLDKSKSNEQSFSK